MARGDQGAAGPLKKAINCLAARAGEILGGTLAYSAEELTNGGRFAWVQTWVLENGAGTALTNSGDGFAHRRKCPDLWPTFQCLIKFGSQTLKGIVV